MITDNRCPRCGGIDGHTPGCPDMQKNATVSYASHGTCHHACDCREAKIKLLVLAARKSVMSEFAKTGQVDSLVKALLEWEGEFDG